VNKNILVVGAGFAGATVARELAENGYHVDVIDARNHIGGNSYDFTTDYGIRVHKYGPHVFHTDNQEVWDWASRFTEWIPYQHRVKGLLADGRYVTLPPNDETISMVGKENLYDIFVKPYSTKMWGFDPAKLDPSVLRRFQTRPGLKEEYYPTDQRQGLPKAGYEAMFHRIFDRPNIKVFLKQAYRPGNSYYDHIFMSAPIDVAYGFEFGELDYRSIKFTDQIISMPRVLPVSVVNFTHSGPQTRVTEWKNFPGHGDDSTMTLLTFETPCDYHENHQERYYPIKDPEGIMQARYAQYRERSKLDTNITCIGRLGLYSYLDQDAVIASSLATVKKFLAKRK
jgi:UDP-galactopyranose mutase